MWVRATMSDGRAFSATVPPTALAALPAKLDAAPFEADHLAAVDGDRHVAHDLACRVGLGQVLGVQGGHCVAGPSLLLSLPRLRGWMTISMRPPPLWPP